MLLLEGRRRRAEGPRRPPRSSSSAPRPRTTPPRFTISASWRSSGRRPDARLRQGRAIFPRSAEAGDDDGAYSYGVMLREGKGVPQDSSRWRIGSSAPPTAASSPARSNMRSCCSTARACRRTKPARSRSSDRRGEGQPDRPEPHRPSLRRRPRGRARSRQGRRLERLRQGGRPDRPGASTWRPPI